MSSPDVQQPLSTIQCDVWRSAVRSGGQQTVSFLLLERLTIPLLGCDDHLEQFSSICELSTDDTAEIVHHRPAGGLSCPSCRLAPYNTSYPLIRVRDGAIVPIACPEHQSEIVQRFQTGLRTQQQLTSDFVTHIDS
ncbi:hypothetical protein HTZ84_11625 [Haloterrigena sp. SYSU A558-1]|uniref:Uncharacterized protein n=1 Tax=Haloterrigena gelatinilytica TaxID=2741724 RepID=A0ABX2L9S2_9EURY|nr:hypothetical protein [Haloterrigena gelatinilytica]NUC72952.1 hypothetical protein [Haloterrigena gelatinilytica]